MRVFRIRTLLLGVALLPLAGLMAFAARDAFARWQTSRDAQLVVTDAELVGHYLTANDALESELTAADALVQVASLGLEVSFVEDQLGVDLAGALAPARVRFDTAMAALAEARDAGIRFAAPELFDEARAGLGQLESLRVEVDAGRADPDAVVELRANVMAALDEAASGQLEALANRAAPLGNGPELDNAVQLAEQTVVVIDLVRREAVDLTRFLVPVVYDGAGDPGSDLAITAALLEHEVEHLETLLEGESLTSWSEFGREAAVAEFEAVRDAALTGEIDPFITGFDLSLAATAIETGVVRTELINALAVEANEDVRMRAAAIGDAARRHLRLSVVVAAIVGLVTVFGSVLMTRSLVGPLQRLESRARRITPGELTTAAEPSGGPREIVVVDAALSELVAGLEVLEVQAEALSAGDLSAAALETATPSRLGRSLQGSVHRLSEMTARLEHQARHDTLTGLLNRAAGIDAIALALARAEGSGLDVALLFVDLDGFKGVNDVHGHSVGDRVLHSVAGRLRNCCRPIDAVARLGGDEFIVVMDDVREIADAIEIASRIVEGMAQPFAVDGLTLVLSASIGIAWSHRGSTPASDLLVQADLALYRAKERGKARVEIFDEHLQHVVEHRARVETGLRVAFDNGELELWYQPIVGLNPRQVWGMEALVRWRTASGELVLPGEFIPVAERSDLILELDRLVLRRACEQLVRWERDGLTAGLQLSANVSGRHLDTGDLVGDLVRIVAATGASAERLTVELTETRLIEDLDGVTDAVNQLRDLSVGVAIDDFGTGYSSVAHLRRLPVTRLKIDRSFVSGSDTPTDRSLLELLVWLGSTLDLEVVAEGIEDRAQLDLVTRLGCTHAQGYLLGRPMPIDAVSGWLASLGSLPARSPTS